VYTKYQLPQERESLASTKASARQQCEYKGP